MNKYTLIMANGTGATETTKHSQTEEVCAQIRTWQAETMTCVVKLDGKIIYDGESLKFATYSKEELELVRQSQKEQIENLFSNYL